MDYHDVLTIQEDVTSVLIKGTLTVTDLGDVLDDDTVVRGLTRLKTTLETSEDGKLHSKRVKMENYTRNE